ncbi:MAG: DNA polymerase IV, partial [Leptospiraceae bacterium]|nr:DNA polymerase IV [Leptospiraceae bacterium]
ENLPIGDFFGIGKVTEEKMKKLGIFKGKDLKGKSILELEKIFGKHGRFYYNIVRGIDNSNVISSRLRKSVGTEETFSEDIIRKEDIISKLKELLIDLEKRIEKSNVKGKTITLKIKFSDFEQITRSNTLPHFVSNSEEILPVLLKLLKPVEIKKSIRLLGVSLSNLNTEKSDQLELF